LELKEKGWEKIKKGRLRDLKGVGKKNPAPCEFLKPAPIRRGF